MGHLFLAEHLKMKRTMTRKLLVLAPVITLGISLLAGSFFYSCAFNWWYTMFFPIVLAIICVQIQEKEKKKLNYQNVYMLPVAFGRLWAGKSCLAFVYGLFACMLLSVLTAALAMAVGITMKTGLTSALLAGVVIPLLCAYQIPIYMILAKGFNFLAALLSAIFFAAAGIAFAEKSLWFIIPPAWCNRAMYSVLGILRNGLFLEKGQEGMVPSGGAIAACCFASAVLFLAGILITGSMAKGEAEKK